MKNIRMKNLKARIIVYLNVTILMAVSTISIVVYSIAKNQNVSKESLRTMLLAIFIVFVISIFCGCLSGFLFAGSVAKPLRKLEQQMDIMANGDMSVELLLNDGSEIGTLTNSANKLRLSLIKTLQEIKNVTNSVDGEATNLSSISEELSASMQEISSAINEVSSGSVNQASELVNINQTIFNFSEALIKIGDILKEVSVFIEDIDVTANGSEKDLKDVIMTINNINKIFMDTIVKMSYLRKSVEEASGIITIINGIANQTNLLSLNASIEAARAGEAGRGFSVVADEIRKLSAQSKESAEKISNLLNGMEDESIDLVTSTQIVNKELQKGTKDINTTIVSFNTIISKINLMSPDIKKVIVGINQINNDKEGMILKTEEVAAVSEENSASAEEIAASSEQMSQVSITVTESAQKLAGSSDKLVNQLNKFKL